MEELDDLRFEVETADGIEDGWEHNMNQRLLALLRNIVEELDDLRFEVETADGVEDEMATLRHIEREILLEALKKGE